MASRKGHKGAVAPVLDHILSDQRLTRLFSDRDGCCALQLWILQISSEQATENRLLYGRLVPYSYASQAWSASDRDSFEPVEGAQAQVVRLNLYHSTMRSADLIRRLSEGWTIAEISRELGFKLSPALERRFGSVALIPDMLAFRPVSHLLNRAALWQRGPTSPHESAGALSASITPLDKTALLRVGGIFGPKLARLAFRRLKEETGMDFREADSARLGDLECLVFPTLDDSERTLLAVERTPTLPGIQVHFDPVQLPSFAQFQVRLCITNDREVVHTAIARASRAEDGRVGCEFPLDAHLYAIADTAEVEVFGGQEGSDGASTLCCRWGIGYVREINIQTHVSGATHTPIKFDWLEKTTGGVALERVAKALTLNHGRGQLSSRVGGRIADPWAQANRDLETLLRRLDPPKSSGGFFPRWGCSNGEGRLRFVEWLRSVLARHPQHQIAIFDPYFEASGLALLLLGRSDAANYLVFTSLPKRPPEGKPQRRKHDGAGQERLRVLLASCQKNAHLFGHNFQLRIYGLKEGWLHDRYLLIMGPDGLPVAGYNLSNSLQMVSENFPLLVTPIPADTLFEVERYKADLVSEARAPSTPDNSDSPISLLYDSTAASKTLDSYKPLAMLDRDNAGEVLSAWVDDESLRGLKGEPLIDRLRALGFIQDESLVIEDLAGLQALLSARDGDFNEFRADWDVIGELLANSTSGDHSFQTLDMNAGFLAFLKGYIESSFVRSSDSADARGPTVPAKLFQETIETLLSSMHRGEIYHYPVKYKQLSWSEYYAIRILWTCAPNLLVEMMEERIGMMDPQAPDPNDIILAVLSQSLSEISLSLMIGIEDAQLHQLLESPVGVFQRLGLEAIEQQMHASWPSATASKWLASLTGTRRIQVLGWMVQRAARDPGKVQTYGRLVAALLESLPEQVSAKRLADLVDAMRGHMRTLPWAEPWLFDDVVVPLLHSNRASVEAAGDIWMRELVALLGPKEKGDSRLFDPSREGRTTNVAAALFANSNDSWQTIHIRKVRNILDQQRRIIQQPLSSTSNWAYWHDALTVSLWISGFARWALYYQGTLDKDVADLEQLAKDADSLVAVRNSEEWTSVNGSMIEFISKVMELQEVSDIQGALPRKQ
jgi:hypothetical protein